jgi:hypothetical protein
MSTEDVDVTLANLRSVGLADDFCFSSTSELLKAIEQNFKAVIPNTITNVIVSNAQPQSTERNSVWFRLSNSGTFTGIYMFTGTTWAQVIPAPNQVIWMYGDSNNVPVGFQLVDSNNPNFTIAQVNHIKSFYYPAGAGPYSYFAVTFSGF